VAHDEAGILGQGRIDRRQRIVEVAVQQVERLLIAVERIAVVRGNGDAAAILQGHGRYLVLQGGASPRPTQSLRGGRERSAAKPAPNIHMLYCSHISSD
jgi:hypothetical protein